MTTLPALIPPTTTGAIYAGIMSSQADTDHELVALWIGQSASRHTRRNYERQSARFLAFIGRPLASVRVGDVQAYLASLGDVAPATRANATAVVKSLLSFAQLTGFLRYNVGKVIKVPPVKNTLAERILPEAGTLRMIALETSPRNRALLTLIYGGGLRIAEACGLRWRDLSERDDDAGQVTLYGKGGKTRVVLVSANTWHLLSDIRGEAGPDDAVFRSRKGGGALDESAVHRVVKTAAARAGLSPEASAHWLRHAHASHALDRGAPISLVQQTLGHASVATTGRYLHARPSDSSARYLGV